MQAFITGKAYFADLLKETAAAKSQILVAGWQVNWDALLAPGVRLYDALYQAADENPALKIYVMPWHDHEPVQTYDDQTKVVLEVINERLGRTQVVVLLSPSYATTDASYFSHHQKQMVIDARIAYVGGMDIAYGRYCDELYKLQADADGRHGLNRYNPCVVQVGDMPEQSCADPDKLQGAMDRNLNLRPVNWPGKKCLPEPTSQAKETAKKIQNGAWQLKYKPGDLVAASNSRKHAMNLPDRTTLDPSRQPRMPWQDLIRNYPQLSGWRAGTWAD